MIMKLLHHIFLVWYCMSLFYLSIHRLWCISWCKKMGLFLVLADIAGIAPLPLLFSLQHVMGNLHKCHSSSVSLRPERFLRETHFRAKDPPQYLPLPLCVKSTWLPFDKNCWFRDEIVDSQTAEDSTAWHEDLSFGKMNSRELTQPLGYLWHLLSLKKPCLTAACDTDGNCPAMGRSFPTAVYKTSSKVHTVLQRRREILKGRNVTEVNLNHISDNSTGRTADINHLCACLISSVSEYFCCQ